MDGMNECIKALVSEFLRKRLIEPMLAQFCGLDMGRGTSRSFLVVFEDGVPKMREFHEIKGHGLTADEIKQLLETPVKAQKPARKWVQNQPWKRKRRSFV